MHHFPSGSQANGRPFWCQMRVQFSALFSLMMVAPAVELRHVRVHAEVSGVRARAPIATGNILDERGAMVM